MSHFIQVKILPNIITKTHIDEIRNSRQYENKNANKYLVKNACQKITIFWILLFKFLSIYKKMRFLQESYLAYLERVSHLN